MLPRDAEDNICTEVSLPIQIKPKLLLLFLAKEQLSSASAAVAPAKGLIHEQPRCKGRLDVTKPRLFHQGPKVGDKTAPPQTEKALVTGHTVTLLRPSLGPLPTTKKHFETENQKKCVVSLRHSLDRKRLQFFHKLWDLLLATTSQIRDQELSSSRWGRNNPRIRSFRKNRKHVWDCSVYMIA